MVEKKPQDLTWPLHGMQPRIIRLRRDVTELEQRLTSLEHGVKEVGEIKSGSPEKKTTAIKINQEKKSNCKEDLKEIPPESQQSTSQSTSSEEKQDKNNNMKDKNKDKESIDKEMKTKIGKKEEASGKDAMKKEIDINKKVEKKTKKQKTKTVSSNKNKMNNTKNKTDYYSIDCSSPAGDKILDAKDLKLYLSEKFKVDGKVNNFGNKVTFDLNNDDVITITFTGFTFSKRYLKYLTKRYLKKHNLRDWMRVVKSPVCDKAYVIKYFKYDCGTDGSDEE